ncbi:protein NDUFAF4 homolog [Planococcus citri]|uniref:protein NDUFAF4 homolog n=1 Tax=Planococcus citri TaxID=170843 RepID=UPI0031F9ECFF
MGNTFTVLGRHALKRVRRFNVQSRTEKYLERHQDKPERAPLYEATMREVEKLMKEMPDLTEEMKKKDGILLNNLRKVYVTSEGDNKDSFSQERIDSSREARFLQAIKPKEVLKDAPPGKYTMQQALTIIQQYQRNPITNSTKALAAQFNLEPSVVAKITKHVKILDYYAPKKTKETSHEKMLKDLIPISYQGKSESDLLIELQQEADKRTKLLFEKTVRLREAKTKEEIYIESDQPIEGWLSKETSDKKEQVYTDLEIYRKTGKLPDGPKLIEGRKLDDLTIEDIKRLTANKSDQDSPEKPSNDGDKESEKKNVPEDQRKATN